MMQFAILGNTDAVGYIQSLYDKLKIYETVQTEYRPTLLMSRITSEWFRFHTHYSDTSTKWLDPTQERGPGSGMHVWGYPIEIDNTLDFKEVRWK